MQSVHITSKVVSSNPIHGEVYSIQHYVIEFVSDLQQVGGFSLDSPVSSTNKTDHHDIAEILLKIVLDTITHPIALILSLDCTNKNNIGFYIFSIAFDWLPITTNTT